MTKRRDELIIEAEQLRHKGLSYQKIADKVGVKSDNTVRLWLDPGARERESISHKLYYRKHKKEINQKNRAYSVMHQDKLREYSKEYYQNHKAEHLENGRKWAEANPECAHEIQVRYREKNREACNERSRNWATNHKKYYAERMRLWRVANKERSEENNRQYRETHREECRAKSRQYYANNIEKVKNYREQHKDEYLTHARMRKAKINEYDKILQEEYDVIFNNQNGLCAYCEKPMITTGNSHDPNYKTMDHIYPLSRGGPHTISNIVFACRSCNLSKNIKTIMEWRPGLLPKIGNGVCEQQKGKAGIQNLQLCLELSN